MVTAVHDSAGGAIPALAARPATAAIARTAEESLATATRWTAFTAAGFLLVGLIAATRLGREQSKLGREQSNLS